MRPPSRLIVPAVTIGGTAHGCMGRAMRVWHRLRGWIVIDTPQPACVYWNARSDGCDKPPWRNGIRGRLRACARKGVVVRVHSGAPDTLECDGMRLWRPRRYVSRSRGFVRGRLAQPEEHLVYTERVRGSSPLPPTFFSPRFLT